MVYWIEKSDDGKISVVTSGNITIFDKPKSKKKKEFDDLQNFKRVLNKCDHRYKFRLLRDGGDPPDFVISRGRGEIGLELTVIESGSRRAWSRYFSRFQDALLERFRSGRLQNISGLRIAITFGQHDGMPFALGEKRFEELVSAFEQLAKRPWWSAPVNSIEKGWPLGAEGATLDGTVSWYVEMYSTAPVRGSALANEAGFEVINSHGSSVTGDEAQALVVSAIARKDKPGNDELLISVGSPGLDGRAFPSDQATISYMLFEGWTAPVAPKYLKRVFIDVWGADKVYVIYDCDS